MAGGATASVSQAEADARAHRIDLDAVGRAELEVFDFTAREHVFGQHVIHAEGSVEAEDILAVADVAEWIVGADIGARSWRLRIANTEVINVDVTLGVDL